MSEALTCQEVTPRGKVCGMTVKFRVLEPLPVRSVCGWHQRGKLKTEPLVISPFANRCTAYDAYKLPRSAASRREQAGLWRKWRSTDRLAANQAFMTWWEFRYDQKRDVWIWRGISPIE